MIGMPHTECVSAERQTAIARLKHRHERVKFRYWRRFVCHEARKVCEGKRWIRVKDAEAFYQVAALPGGRMAFRKSMELGCGSHHSSSSPWELVKSREEGIEKFRASVRWHFQHHARDDARSTKAKNEMLAVVDGEGLFGWVEPQPEAAK